MMVMVVYGYGGKSEMAKRDNLLLLIYEEGARKI